MLFCTVRTRWFHRLSKKAFWGVVEGDLTVNHPLLAALGIQTSRIPVLEEVVHTGTVCKDVGAIDDSKTPGSCAVELCTFSVGWVCEGCLCCERLQGGRIPLVVSCFMLDQAHEDVAGV